MKILFVVYLSTYTVADQKLNHLHCMVVDINMPYAHLIAIAFLVCSVVDKISTT